MKHILSEIDRDKINIRFNSNPIPMKLFLSFLTVPVKRVENCHWHYNGWTEHAGDDGLIIRGGILPDDSTEYIDSIKWMREQAVTNE